MSLKGFFGGLGWRFGIEFWFLFFGIEILRFCVGIFGFYHFGAEILGFGVGILGFWRRNFSF